MIQKRSRITYQDSRLGRPGLQRHRDVPALRSEPRMNPRSCRLPAKHVFRSVSRSLGWRDGATATSFVIDGEDLFDLPVAEADPLVRLPRRQRKMTGGDREFSGDRSLSRPTQERENGGEMRDEARRGSKKARVWGRTWPERRRGKRRERRAANGNGRAGLSGNVDLTNHIRESTRRD